jgi:hypothetical protein
MCFSPSASFGAAALLGVTGIAALAVARSPGQRTLSGIPLLFAVQQVAEGFLWLSLMHREWAHLTTVCTYAFLIFAQVIWPVYVPLAVFLLEKDQRRKRLIGLLLAVGALFAAYIQYALIRYPVAAEIQAHHIRYNLGFALAHQWYYGLLYFIPTILAPLLASNKMLHWLGYLFLGSYVVARLSFHLYVISVWCFFGAIISIVVFFMVQRMAFSEKQSGKRAA